MNRSSDWKGKLRSVVRSSARPFVAGIRRWMDPPPPPATLQSVSIRQGALAGLKLTLPSPSALADAIADAQYEAMTIRLLPLLIQPNDICYDIGGHYGVFSMHMARLASSGQVHTFEPIPHLAQSIAQSIRSNNIQNITLHQAAMSDRVGTLVMRVADASGDDSMAYIEGQGGVQTPRSQLQYGRFQPLQVPCVTLDNSSTPPPQFIKMDIEGAEIAAVSSGLKMIAEHRPRLLIEVHGVERGLALAHMLGPLGYTAWQVAPLAIAPQILWLHRNDQAAIAKITPLQEPTPVPLFGLPQCASPSLEASSLDVSSHGPTTPNPGQGGSA